MNRPRLCDQHQPAATRRLGRVAPRLLRWLIALAVLAAVLEPTVWRGLLRVPAPELAQVQALRATPAAPRLQEIAAFSLQDIPMPRGPEAVRMTDRLLAGQDFMQGFSGWPYALPFTDKAAASDLALQRAGRPAHAGPVVYQLPFSQADLLRPDGVGRLPYASLYLADLILQAFDATGNERYLAAARDMILGFARYERVQWRAHAFVWNDHALAARAGVLARFWYAWRQHPLYDDAQARELLDHAARTAALLASPRDFNVRTNHGVMQNLGLMQLSLAFPQLDNAQQHWATGLQRLSAQVPFLYAEDGFVLEHSAHYHDVGVQLLAMAVRLVELAGEPVPVPWRERLAAAQQRLADITRPDGTLPAYGDTELEFWPHGSGLAPAAASGSAAETRFAAYPLSGYALWSFAAPQASHSVAVWSRFEGHGHKLGDELGLLLWGGGRGWVTHTGYWNYGDWGRRFTEGWQGSNAPHGVHDDGQQPRNARLDSAAYGEEAVYLDLRREHADGARFRREVLSLASGLWLVVDSAQAARAPQLQTLWTFFPDMVLRARGEQDFVLRDDAGAEMRVALRAEGPLRVEPQRGSREPFAGWVTMGRAGLPAPALRVLWTQGTRSAAMFSLDPRAAEGFVFEPAGDDGWRAQGDGWSVQRSGGTVQWRQGGREQSLVPAAPADARAAQLQVRASFEQALAVHPREPNLDSYRDRVAKLLLAALLVQEAALAGLRRFVPALRSRRAAWTLSLGLVGLWIAGGWWLQAVYFQVG